MQIYVIEYQESDWDDLHFPICSKSTNVYLVHANSYGNQAVVLQM